MELNFGERILEANLERLDLEDLQHSKANALSSEIFKAVKESVMNDIRAALRVNDISRSQHLEGYLTCLEDLVDLYEHNIPEVLKSK